MNYTGLGVCNRNGVYIQLAGCCLAVAGMIFAFYAKPVIRRRNQQRTRAKLQERDPTKNGKPTTAASSGVDVDSVATADIM